MKKNNILIAVLLGLVLLFVTTNYFKKNSSASFKANLVALDSSQVDKIYIHSPLKQHTEPIIISREANRWKVAQGNSKADANQRAVKNVLRQLQQLKVERLVAKTKDKWKAYELTDSLAQKVEVYEKGSGKRTKLYFGKTNFQQPENAQYGPGAMNGFTYFRMNDNAETYVVKSERSTAFNKAFNAWRNPEFIKLDKEVITQLEFENADSGNFTVVKKDSVWTLGETPVDAAKLKQYLNVLRQQNSTQFADDFTPKDEADYTLTVHGDSAANLHIKAYKETENKFFLNSSQHPNVFVSSDSTGLFKRLFVAKEYFLKN